MAAADSLLHNAIHNNAAWCHLMAEVHGVEGRFDSAVWQALDEMPPLYPNVISLQSAISEGVIETAVRKMPEHCGFKDSFAELNLKPFGFSELFTAKWYGCVDKIEADTSEVRLVDTADTLEKWIDVWGGSPGDVIFKPLLLESNVEFIACHSEDKIVAGLITNASHDVVGISNLFGESEDLLPCLAFASERAESCPLVGYGSDDELQWLSRLGFKKLGPLKIWTR